LKPYQFFTSFS